MLTCSYAREKRGSWPWGVAGVEFWALVRRWFGCREEVCDAMTNGPIEFVGAVSEDDKGPTEFGGRAGLVQGGVSAGEVHAVSASEGRGMIVRSVPVMVLDPVTGFLKVDEGAPAVDPFTGAVVDAEWNLDGVVPPVDAPPKTAPPSAGVF